MTRAQEIYASVAAHLEDAVTLPSAAYKEEAVFADEAEHVLRAGWLPVARTSEVPDTGSYKSLDILGDALMVTRDEAGDLHVLSRVCRHRAMLIAEGTGTVKTLSCPYHLWRYALDGQLISAPGMEKSAQFSQDKCSLPQIRHEEWGGWVFINLSGDALPLADQIAPLKERLEPFDPQDLVIAGTIEFESPWNWKVMVENFLESYHHIGTHVETLQRSNPGLQTYGVDVDGPFAILENPPRSDQDEAFVAACIFPLGLMAAAGGDFPFCTWYEFCDIEKDRFLLKVHLIVSEEIASEPTLVEAGLEQLRAIHIEDIAACTGLQQGLQSSLYASGPMSHLEKCNWQFHRFLQSCFSGE